MLKLKRPMYIALRWPDPYDRDLVNDAITHLLALTAPFASVPGDSVRSLNNGSYMLTLGPRGPVLLQAGRRPHR
jgi:hypothetical protein